MTGSGGLIIVGLVVNFWISAYSSLSHQFGLKIFYVTIVYGL